MHDKCPFCDKRLVLVDMQQNDMGTKVSFRCMGGMEHEQGQVTEFFAYTGELEW
jgi:hypothetical protein